MGKYAETIERLMAEFGKLPGIGARSAERLAFHILKATEPEALALADAIRDVKTKIHPCKVCFNLAEDDLCPICADPRRDRGVICVVEQPKDLLSLEATGAYQGVYHVLMGHIAPLDGSEPEDLTIDALVDRVKAEQATGNRQQATGKTQQDHVPPDASCQLPVASPVREVILATNPTVAGDGTSLHIAGLLAPLGVKITRLARGLATGSSIEYANKSILSDAINERRQV